MDKHIDVPFDSSVSTTLKAGDYVYLRELYTLQEMQRIKECTKLLKEVKSCLLM